MEIQRRSGMELPEKLQQTFGGKFPNVINFNRALGQKGLEIIAIVSFGGFGRTEVAQFFPAFVQAVPRIP